MPYNLGMDQITIVLPFALPPPELAPDLLREMKVPALAALLSRTTTLRHTPFDNSSRILPHEAWLAAELGLGTSERAGEHSDSLASAPLATSAMRGFGLDASAGHWFFAHPVHVQIARNHLLMGDPRQLPIDEASSRALFDAAKPYFDELGKPLLYGDAQTWFVRADDWTGLRTASPDAAAGQNLSGWMPEGEGALASRKLQNEVQMLWHEHPANEARQARGLPPVNSYWMWGGASAPAPALNGGAVFAGDCPAWIAALATPERRQPDFAAVASGEGKATVVLGSLMAAAIGSDWGSWLMQLQRLEEQWLAPALQGLKTGAAGGVTLVLSNRDGLLEASSGRNAQRKFWRSINLNQLLTEPAAG
jgi:hypothetical protein